MDKIVAIHQPNFFPWLGFFDKIARADVFLFFDDVQFPKTGSGVWSNRVKLLIGGEARWVTAAIVRDYHGTRQIRDMHFLTNNQWREKMCKSLQSNYCRHPFYHETMSVIEPLIMNTESNISDYNIHAITQVAHCVGLDIQKLKRSSEFGAEGSSNKLLIALTLRAGGNIYMCGGGADGYQEPTLFEESGIVLQYQNFQHPAYPQFKTSKFIPGLSIIDAAMNIGWDGVSKLLR